MNGSDFLASLAITLSGSIANVPPPQIQKLPLNLTLAYSSPNSGTPVNGTLTLYSVTKNADGTFTSTGVANWNVLNGQTTAWIPVTQATTMYQFELANGQTNVPQVVFVPGFYYSFLENLVTASPPVTVTASAHINLATGAVTADPGSVAW